jgi:chaperonin GroEL (HSP60 family)
LPANSGWTVPAVVIEKVRMLHVDGKMTTGYDVIGNDYVDMLQAGIMRPGQGERGSAVENAASIAAMILYARRALVCDIPGRKTSPSCWGRRYGHGHVRP